jgi:hypothetical protein
MKLNLEMAVEIFCMGMAAGNKDGITFKVDYNKGSSELLTDRANKYLAANMKMIESKYKDLFEKESMRSYYVEKMGAKDAYTFGMWDAFKEAEDQLKAKGHNIDIVLTEEKQKELRDKCFAGGAEDDTK